MRNVRIDDIDHVTRAVIAIGTDYPPGHLLPMHSHRRAQLLYGATGVMHVFTQQGNWVVPPQHAVWLPPQMPHAVRMVGVTTRSLYLEPGALPAERPQVCQVVSVTPLMRQLLMAAVDMPLEYEREGRDGALAALLLHELARLQPLPLHIPLPADPRLGELCHAFCSTPTLTTPRSGGPSSVHEHSHLQPLLSRADRPAVFAMAPTRLRGAGAGAAGRRAQRNAGGDGNGI